MYKNTAKHRQSNQADYDLYADLVRIRDAFTDTARNVKGRTGLAFTQQFENVKDKTTELQDNMANYAREKPFKTLGLALLSGVFLGFWLRRK